MAVALHSLQIAHDDGAPLAVVLPLKVHDDEGGQWSRGPSIQPALYPALGSVAVLIHWTDFLWWGSRASRGERAALRNLWQWAVVANPKQSFHAPIEDVEVQLELP